MNNILIVTSIIILSSITSCDSSCDSITGSQHKLTTLLLKKMRLSVNEDVILKQTDCLHLSSKILEKLTEHQRHTKFVHFKEYYLNYHDLKRDSLSFVNKLSNLSEEELHRKINQNCNDVTRFIESDCLTKKQRSNFKIYLNYLKLKCYNEK